MVQSLGKKKTQTQPTQNNPLFKHKVVYGVVQQTPGPAVEHRNKLWFSARQCHNCKSVLFHLNLCVKAWTGKTIQSPRHHWRGRSGSTVCIGRVTEDWRRQQLLRGFSCQRTLITNYSRFLFTRSWELLEDGKQADSLVLSVYRLCWRLHLKRVCPSAQ